MRIVLFNPGLEGGIVKYGWCQADAFRALEAEVTVLAAKNSSVPAPVGVNAERVLADEGGERSRWKVFRAGRIAGNILRNEWQLALKVMRDKPDAVVLATYMEYLSPLWVFFHLLAKWRTGTTYVAVLHDPVRDFVVGPRWWHDLSVRMAFWPLSAVFIHHKLPAAAYVPPRLQVREVPHGLYQGAARGPRRPTEVRASWNLPEDSVALLSFGFIRDGKNLDLLIRALSHCPAASLIIMGRVQSEAVCRPVSFYRELAEAEGVQDRVRFIEGFVPDDELGPCLEAADAIAMTYSASFHSQSGVLNTVAAAAKPVLASSGESPLKECVERFQLGMFVEPDDADAVIEGLRVVCDLVSAQRQGLLPHAGAPALDWEGYRRYASWETNARVILDTVAEVRGGKQECLAQRR
jgi:glycosyltransferase involved in cell wall biosynthesis